MNDIVLIYNWRAESHESFLRYLNDRSIQYTVIDNPDDGERRYFKWYKIVNSLECFALAIKALLVARRSKTIISMCATPGILAALLKRSDQKLLVLNLLCHSTDTPNLLEKTRNYIYSRALNKPNVWATCNAEQDIDKYCSQFNLLSRSSIIHLPDGIDLERLSNLHNDIDDVAESGTSSQWHTDVFSCGASARDWGTLARVINDMPLTSFSIVATQGDWKSEYSASNASVRFHIPHDEYLSLLCRSRVVALPLNSDATAGLLVMFDAFANDKCVVITRTKTTEQFIPEWAEELLLVDMGDAEQMKDKISTLLNMGEWERTAIAREVAGYIESHFSELERCKAIERIVELMEEA